jgi:hypothetical protein
MAMKGKQLSFTVALIVADRQKGEGKLEAIVRRPPLSLSYDHSATSGRWKKSRQTGALHVKV